MHSTRAFQGRLSMQYRSTSLHSKLLKSFEQQGKYLSKCSIKTGKNDFDGYQYHNKTFSDKGNNGNCLFRLQRRSFGFWSGFGRVCQAVVNTVHSFFGTCKSALDYAMGSVDTSQPSQSSQSASKENQAAEKKGEEIKYPIPTWPGFDMHNINIGIIGESGSGKSSFINTLLDLKGDNKAKTGVTETTGVLTKIKSYQYDVPIQSGHNPRKVMFWDLPGCGTQAFKIGTYLKDMGLPHFDALILITSCRFTENDDNLANQVSKLKEPVPLFMIRSKFDIDCENEIRDNDIQWNQLTPNGRKEMVSKLSYDIKQSAQRELQYSFDTISDCLYVVSSTEPGLTMGDWASFYDHFMHALAKNRHCDKNIFSKIKQKCDYIKNMWVSVKDTLFNNNSDYNDPSSNFNNNNNNNNNYNNHDNHQNGNYNNDIPKYTNGNMSRLDPTVQVHAKNVNINKNQFKDYTCEQVAQYVKERTKCNQLPQLMLQHNINGELFLELDDDVQHDLGINSKLEMKRLMLAVENAKKM